MGLTVSKREEVQYLYLYKTKTISYNTLSHNFPFTLTYWVFLFVCFLGLHMWHMDIPRLGVES